MKKTQLLTFLCIVELCIISLPSEFVSPVFLSSAAMNSCVIIAVQMEI